MILQARLLAGGLLVEARLPRRLGIFSDDCLTSVVQVGTGRCVPLCVASGQLHACIASAVASRGACVALADDAAAGEEQREGEEERGGSTMH